MNYNFNDYLKDPEHNRILVITHFKDYSKVIKKNPSITHYLTSKIAYDYYKTKFKNVKLFDPSIMKRVDIDLNPNLYWRVSSCRPVEYYLKVINERRPGKLIYITNENYVTQFDSEVSIAELLCIIHGIKFVKTSPIISNLMNHGKV